jgi:hypothetical protein
MVHCTCCRIAIGLLYEFDHMVTEIYDFVMMSLGSNSCFVTNAPCLNEGHGYGFASNVGHLRWDSVRLLVYDVTHTIYGVSCCITSALRMRQPCREGVNILGRPYGE